MKIIWVLVNCNTVKEAKAIGLKALKQRLSSCYDIFPRLITQYYWPPKSGKIDSAKGCLLVLETFPKYFKKLETLIKKNHSDKLPFIGSVDINSVSPQFTKWMKGELK
jgi:uncharacterized protein involved in tolerance to divalent cations